MNPLLEDREVTSTEVLEKARAGLTVEGEVASVAARKLALERLAALPEVTGIIEMAAYDAWCVTGVDEV